MLPCFVISFCGVIWKDWSVSHPFLHVQRNSWRESLRLWSLLHKINISEFSWKFVNKTYIHVDISNYVIFLGTSCVISMVVSKHFWSIAHLVKCSCFCNPSICLNSHQWADVLHKYHPPLIIISVPKEITFITRPYYY